MIYGLSFNGRAIPQKLTKKFPKELKKFEITQWDLNTGLAVGTVFRTDRGYVARLVGVAQTDYELGLMLSQADNGHRRMHVELRWLDGTWYGIYTF